MQPTHCTSDSHYVTSRIGSHRAAIEAYSLRQAGARLAFGSDFSAEYPSVIEEIWSAVTRTCSVDLDDTRRRRKGAKPQPKPWYPHQALSVSQAVRAFTINAAFAQYEERE